MNLKKIAIKIAYYCSKHLWIQAMGITITIMTITCILTYMYI